MVYFTRSITSPRGAVFFVAPLLAGALLSSPIYAQELEWPSNADEHPGEVVFARDVPYGSATRRFSQGEASTVVPDQSRILINSLMTGLEPLSDSEQANVAAPLGRGLSLGMQALETGLARVTAVNGGIAFTRSESGASSTGGIISNSLSVLPSALKVIGANTGRGQ